MTVGMAIALTYISFAGIHTGVQAQFYYTIPTENVQVPTPPPGPEPPRSGRGGGTYFSPPSVPPGPAPGGRHRGGATRNLGNQVTCPATDIPLTALVPFQEKRRFQTENHPPILDVWGYTAAAHPTFWFYVPYTKPAIPSSFTLQTDETEPVVIYETAITLPSQPGIIGIRLPANHATALQVGKRYRWFFNLECKPANAAIAATDAIYVEGVVYRDQVKPSLANQLPSVQGIQKAALYAAQGFWYDAVTILAELRQQKPQDPILLAEWKRLLAGMALSGETTSSKIENLASQPILNSGDFLDKNYPLSSPSKAPNPRSGAGTR
jgi:hypothetical protein